MIIETNNLNKIFALKPAVKNLNLSVKANSIFGFIGPNGAGKTTTINMLTGIYNPTNGYIKLFNEKYGPNSIHLKKKMGIMLDRPTLFEYLKVNEQLYFSGRIYGLRKEELKSRITELLDIFGMKNDQSKLVYELSAGMKRKLSFMCAIIHNPSLLILDEPFENLDPISSQIVQSILKQYNKCGKTIFLTSHNLPLVEKLCTDVAIINEGEIIMQGSKDKILMQVEKGILVKNNQTPLEKIFTDLVSPNREIKRLSWLH